MSEVAAPQRAAMLVIGNEILSGKIADANVLPLARILRMMGIELARVNIVPDIQDLVAREVASLAQGFDLVVTSGGVGPTHDDLTIPAVAQAFETDVVVSTELEALIRSAYGASVRDGHLVMARIPRGAELISNEEIRWPVVVMRNVWILPGVPEIFHAKAHILRDHFAGAAAFVTRSLRTTLDEGQLKPDLDAVVAEFPEVDVGSYPKLANSTYRTKITFDGRDEHRVTAARDALAARLPQASIAAIE